MEMAHRQTALATLISLIFIFGLSNFIRNTRSKTSAITGNINSNIHPTFWRIFSNITTLKSIAFPAPPTDTRLKNVPNIRK